MTNEAKFKEHLVELQSQKAALREIFGTGEGDNELFEDMFQSYLDSVKWLDTNGQSFFNEVVDSEMIQRVLEELQAGAKLRNEFQLEFKRGRTTLKQFVKNILKAFDDIESNLRNRSSANGSSQVGPKLSQNQSGGSRQAGIPGPSFGGSGVMIGSNSNSTPGNPNNYGNQTNSVPEPSRTHTLAQSSNPRNAFSPDISQTPAAPIPLKPSYTPVALQAEPPARTTLPPPTQSLPPSQSLAPKSIAEIIEATERELSIRAQEVQQRLDKVRDEVFLAEDEENRLRETFRKVKEDGVRQELLNKRNEIMCAELRPVKEVLQAEVDELLDANERLEAQLQNKARLQQESVQREVQSLLRQKAELQEVTTLLDEENQRVLEQIETLKGYIKMDTVGQGNPVFTPLFYAQPEDTRYDEKSLELLRLREGLSSSGLGNTQFRVAAERQPETVSGRLGDTYGYGRSSGGFPHNSQSSFSQILEGRPTAPVTSLQGRTFNSRNTNTHTPLTPTWSAVVCA